jgi:hypothetical protein
VSSERGSILKRNGSTLFTALPPNVELHSLFPCTVSGTKFLLAAGGKNLYSITTAGAVETIGEGFTEGKRWSMVQAPESKEVAAEGPVYMTNGTDKAQYWTGAEAKTKVKEWTGVKTEDAEKRKTYEKAPYVPQGKYMVFVGNRIWMTGIEGDASAVWFSELVPVGEGGSKGDPSDWPKTNVVRFDASDGLPITGIGTVGPYVIVFKESKTWVIHDLNTGANRRIADKVGCIAQRSIVETSGGTFFLTADQGVYLTNGSTVKEMSYNVRPTLLKINPKARENAAGEYWNNHYYISFPYESSEVNNRTLDYDSILKSWWLHDLTGNQWCRFEATAGEPFLFTIPPKKEAGVVKAWVKEVYQDSGKNYAGEKEFAAFWISPWQPFAYYIFRHRIKAPFLKKRVRQIFFDGEGEIIPVVYKNFRFGGTSEPAVVDNLEESTKDKTPVIFSTDTSTFGEGIDKFGEGEAYFGGASKVEAARIYAPGIARVWSVGWGNNSKEPFQVSAYGLMVQFRKS